MKECITIKGGNIQRMNKIQVIFLIRASRDTSLPFIIKNGYKINCIKTALKNSKNVDIPINIWCFFRSSAPKEHQVF